MAHTATKEELDINSKQTLSQRIGSAIGDLNPNMSTKEVLRYLRGARVNLRNLSNEVAKLEESHAELKAVLDMARSLQECGK